MECYSIVCMYLHRVMQDQLNISWQYKRDIQLSPRHTLTCNQVLEEGRHGCKNHTLVKTRNATSTPRLTHLEYQKTWSDFWNSTSDWQHIWLSGYKTVMDSKRKTLFWSNLINFILKLSLKVMTSTVVSLKNDFITTKSLSEQREWQQFSIKVKYYLRPIYFMENLIFARSQTHPIPLASPYVKLSCSST